MCGLPEIEDCGGGRGSAGGRGGESTEGRRAFVAVGDRGVSGGEESHDEEHGESGGRIEGRAGGLS